MKNLFSLFLFLLGFHLNILAQPISSAIEDPNGPVITFKKDTMNFGTVKQGEVVVREFTFTNTGRSPLVITGATGSCSCTVPEYPKQPIAPGKSGVIRVEFKSEGKAGYQDKTATITSNAQNGTAVLHLIGNITVPGSSSPPAK